jgi:hypothetical protein
MIWHRRFVECLPPPWTNDETLRTERFTNVYRELDPGTKYVIEQILELDKAPSDKIFNTMLYRLIGRSETHASIGFQHLNTFSSEHIVDTLKHIRDVEQGSPFTGAYMVSAYTKMGSRDKAENIAKLFGKLHKQFGVLYEEIDQSTSSEEVYNIIRKPYGFGNFLAFQVLVDLLYPLKINNNKPLLPFSHNDWASAGPGAQKGIKILIRDGIKVDDLDVMRWLTDNQIQQFNKHEIEFPFLKSSSGEIQLITLANIQNCLCEFHKYVKIREKTGRGRRKFNPPSEQLKLF